MLYEEKMLQISPSQVSCVAVYALKALWLEDREDWLDTSKGVYDVFSFRIRRKTLY